MSSRSCRPRSSNPTRRASRRSAPGARARPGVPAGAAARRPPGESQTLHRHAGHRRVGTCRWPSASASRSAALFLLLASSAASTSWCSSCWRWPRRPSSSSTSSASRATSRPRSSGIVAVAGLPLAAYWRGDGGPPARVFLAVVATLRLVHAVGRAREQPGAEHRHHPARRDLDRAARRVRRAHPAPAARRRDPRDRGRRHRGLRRRRPVRRLGRRARRQMAGWISPNKTVEGLVGGMLAAILAVVLAPLRRPGAVGPGADARPSGWASSIADRRPARRLRRVDAQAQPRHQGLRHAAARATAAPSTASTPCCSWRPPSTTSPSVLFT